ncbi:phenylalanyl-tRNA synthetase subunit beta [Schizopora paradoxa]|uniref:phenylalanine--tRNA ligase n=1 Tax=Schizopora paradoxa TaxID=27342 RepID=A0A0H2RUZ3_9AGAM|nr:phenylalanyl-tRNA synthetase subunit beta [Schizopora paradoxa]
MPTISVDRDELFERLEKKYTVEEFEHLCFEFGVEYDGDNSKEIEEAVKAGRPAERPQWKIEIPANRYDLLCIEGIARALRIYLGKDKPTSYTIKLPPGGEAALLTTTVDPETAKIRPYFASAILRNIKFTQRSYDSFIALQDKLHQNLCQRRKIVAIGTHDLDTLKPPFRYEARPPQKIKFVPLNKDKAYTAEELMTVYESDRQLSKYLHIIKDSPVYPIIYDETDTVLSMPPIINSEHSKIKLTTRNVFVDVTATDRTKLNIVVNMIATMFSEYCEDPFTIEPVRIVEPNGTVRITPDISDRVTTTTASYINSCTGLKLTSPEIQKLMEKMSLTSSVSPKSPDVLQVSVPATRPDILHECDIMEDVAIAYGYNNLPKTFPNTNTVAQALPVSKLSDVVRRECAQAGWIEVLPFILCSHEENFEWLKRVDDNSYVVKIANPQTQEFQVVRTALLPGLLKTARENRTVQALPIKIFETSDVVFKDASQERQAKNVRHAAALYCNRTAGFEVVHGLLDRIMKILKIQKLGEGEDDEDHEGYYYLREKEDPTFFPGRAATIVFRPNPKKEVSGDKSKLTKVTEGIKSTLKGALSSHNADRDIGVLGVLHPEVLQNFDISFPCSALEFNLEPFLKEKTPIWINP